MDFTLIFILLVSLMGVLAFRFFTRRKKPVIKENTNMVELGFSPIPFPEADFKQVIIRLHHKYPGQQIAVADVYQKVIGQDYVYLFDVEDQAEKESFFLARDMVAIRSTGLQLPRMTFMTRLKAMGGVGNLMDRFVSQHSNWASNLQGLIQINYDNHPEISQRYLVFTTTEAEETVREYLNEDRLSFLSRMENNYVIDALDDTLTVMRATGITRGHRQAQVEQSIKDASSLAEVFKTKTTVPSS